MRVHAGLSMKTGELPGEDKQTVCGTERRVGGRASMQRQSENISTSFDAFEVVESFIVVPVEEACKLTDRAAQQ